MTIDAEGFAKTVQEYWQGERTLYQQGSFHIEQGFSVFPIRFDEIEIALPSAPKRNWADRGRMFREVTPTEARELAKSPYCENREAITLFLDTIEKGAPTKGTTVMVVEDDSAWQRIYKDFLKDNAQVLIAGTHEEAGKVFSEHRRDIALIVMDGNLSGERGVDTLDLVHAFREAGFIGPIVAASGKPEYNEYLMDGGKGCSHGAVKEQALNLVRDLLSDMKPALPQPLNAASAQTAANKL